MVQQNNQYQIPSSPLEDTFDTAPHPGPGLRHPETQPQLIDTAAHHENEALARRFYEVVNAGYETLPDPRLQTIKANGQSFISFRSTATEENLSQTALQKARNLLKAHSKPLEERLVDQESVHGGEIFTGSPFQPDAAAIQERFWYFNDRWYYEAHYADKPTVVISYQVTDRDIFKAVNGSTAPMIAGELDALYVATGLARDRVRHAMYLIDDTLADLQNDDDEL